MKLEIIQRGPDHPYLVRQRHVLQNSSIMSRTKYGVLLAAVIQCYIIKQYKVERAKVALRDNTCWTCDSYLHPFQVNYNYKLFIDDGLEKCFCEWCDKLIIIDNNRDWEFHLYTCVDSPLYLWEDSYELVCSCGTVPVKVPTYSMDNPEPHRSL